MLPAETSAPEPSWRAIVIQLEDVSKIYRTNEGPVHALTDISLRVQQGEFVAVRGPSGCGKSTLLMIVGGLVMPTAGRVVVAREDLPGASRAARARFRAERIGFVFQMFHLLPYLTVLENVTAAALWGRKSTARDRAVELLEGFQLADRGRHRPAELSAGERQRVAIARALVNRPQLILADEPTGNLDPDSAQGVLELLAGFHRDGGTVLLVTHQERAAAYAGRAILLRRGAIQRNGRGDEQ
jgi:putative ABC transport system ATP-binding protein